MPGSALVRRAGLLVAMLLACGIAPHVPAAADRAEELTELLAGLSRKDRIRTLVDLAWVEPPDAEMGRLAEEWLRRDAPKAPTVLVQAFFDVPPAAQVKILELHSELWDLLGRGTDTWRNEMLRVGLMSEHREVRRAAARLLAAGRFHRIAHAAVDAAMADPELTVAALAGIAHERDAHAVRWVCRQALSADPDVAGAARFAVARIGRAAAEHLIPLLEAGEARTRRLALEALLLVASREDVPALFRWVERYGEEEPALRERVLDAISSIESGLYAPETPPAPARLFPDGN